MISVVLFGSGNVAMHLFNAFLKTDEVDVVQVYSRSPKSLKSIEKITKTTSSLSQIAEADVYIICITDDNICNFSKKLRFHKKLVVHTSGSIPLNQIANHNRRGVFYPLQTFTKDKPVDFKSIPICLEAENDNDLKTLFFIANSISGLTYDIDSNQRKVIHTAAVFANNFVNHLYSIAEDLCNDEHIPFDILKPLILETAEKIKDSSPKDIQTGPAKRDDRDVMFNQMTSLKSETHQEIYKLITSSILKQYGH